MARATTALAGGAAALAGAMAANHLAARAAERRFPPQGRFITAGGTRLHYRDSGAIAGDRQPPIIVIHGNGALTDDFVAAGIADRLAATRRVVLFDRPGYGYSERPASTDWTAEAQAAAIAEATARLGIGRAVVVGHSWGVLPALAWALDRPQSVAALVLVSGYYFGTPRLDTALLGIAELPLLGRAFTDGWAPIQTRIIGPLGNRQIFWPQAPTPGYRHDMPFGLMLRPGQVRASAEDGVQMPANAARLSRRYGELGMPITMIWGSDDKMVGQSGQSKEFVRRFPRVRGLELDRHGHMLHHVEPDLVSDAILTAAE